MDTENRYFKLTSDKNGIQKNVPFDYYNGYHLEYFLYDENGNEIKFKAFNSKGELKEEYNNSAGTIIDSTLIYNEYGQIIKKKFNLSNNILKEINYLNDQMIKQTVTYPNNIHSEIIYTDGKPDHQNIYRNKELESTTRYNENGYAVEQLFHTKGVITPRQVYEYNNMNQQIKEIDYDTHGQKSYIYEYKYDENGNVSQRIFLSRSSNGQGFDRSEKTYKYKYDEIGNWIECTEINKNTTIMTKRNIIYYK